MAELQDGDEVLVEASGRRTAYHVASTAIVRFDDAGVVQAFGSDYPVYTMDPIAGIYAVVTRQTRDGSPAGGWHPANRISVEAALRHYTRDAAWSSFEEGLKGTIAAGKYADFAILSHDLLAATPAQLLETRVQATFMGGRETFRSPEFQSPGR